MIHDSIYEKGGGQNTEEHCNCTTVYYRAIRIEKETLMPGVNVIRKRYLFVCLVSACLFVNNLSSNNFQL